MSYSGEEEETPPTPPAGGVCAFSPEPVEPATGNQEPGASPPQTAMPATEQQAVEHVSAAMVQATGHGLSWLEKRRVRREFSGGAGAMLIASITADIVRGARAAMPKNRTFGIGWIIKHAQDVSAKRTAARAVQAAQEQARLSAIAGGREIVADIDAQARQREADAARNLAYFQTLPTDRQEHYRRRAMAAPFAPRTRPDVIEASAAAFAWRDKP